MKKVLVLGSGGVGKSTFSRRLGELTGIEVVHMDKIYWQPNWIEPDKSEWMKIVEKYAEKDAWIMDGNFGSTIDMRLQKCDTVIFLDLPRLTCVYRAVKRFLTYRGSTRPDMGEGCNEKCDYEFLEWIWNYPKKDKPRIEGKLKPLENKIKVFRLKSKREVEKFLANLKTNKA